jgi:hypothetical protein
MIARMNQVVEAALCNWLCESQGGVHSDGYDPGRDLKGYGQFPAKTPTGPKAILKFSLFRMSRRDIRVI